MRIDFKAAVVAATVGYFFAVAGCSSEEPVATPSNEVGSPGETTTDNGKSGIDGNTEPPLPEVSSAVESVPKAATEEPSAGEVEVTIAAASPEDFQAALAEHKGKVVLVDFWATWCKPCVAGLPHTAELARRNADRGLVVLTMCMGDANDGDETAQALEKLKENNVALRNYICTLGGGDESFNAYNIGDSGLPHYKIYGRDGKLAKELRNDVDAGIAVAAFDVDGHIEKLLAK